MVGMPNRAQDLRGVHAGCQPTVHAFDPLYCDELRPHYWLWGDWDGEGVSGWVGCAAGGLGLAAATCLRGFAFFFTAGVIGSSCAITGLGVSVTVGYVPGSPGPVGGAGFTGIVCG